jgi:FlaA1/EpsC-like NDP-sugar epimerase
LIRFFRHYVPLNLLLLILIEALILGGAIFLGVSARFLDGGVSTELQPLLPKALTFTLIMLGLMTAAGLYDLECHLGIRALLNRLGLSFGLGLVVMSLVFYFFPGLLVGRGAFLLSFGMALLGIMASRMLFLRWTCSRRAQDPRSGHRHRQPRRTRRDAADQAWLGQQYPGDGLPTYGRQSSFRQS